MYSRMSWQKPARIGVALVGLTAAAAVYFTMGERRAAPPPPPVHYEDPKANVEITGASVGRFAGVLKEHEIKDATFQYYDDGTTRVTGKPFRLITHKGEKTFTVTAWEGTASKDDNIFEMGGPVRLEGSDGFWLETDKATINKMDSIALIPGAATFGKGRMSGSGVGFSHDEDRQILLISQQAQVKTVDAAGKTVMQLTSGTAVLDRMQHLLTADTGVHVLRDDQVIDTDHSSSRLGANNDIVTFIELHGNSRVTGGPSIEAMSARDINLDYTEDGKTLESVKMAGTANAAMAGEGGTPGLKIAGETVDLALASDGKLTDLVGRGGVRLELPAKADTPPRTITSQALDGKGQAGKGLTNLTFTTDATYTEQPLPAKGPAAEKQGGTRTAHAPKLEVSLTDDAVNEAIFSGGDVTFEETGLKACAGQAEYLPQKGSLKLSGATKAGNPMVAEEQVATEGQTIDVALETHHMTVRGTDRNPVTTWMRSPTVRRCKPSKERATGEQGARNVPRLLNADAPVTIGGALNLDYDSATGKAEYSGGRSTLRQEDTSIIGDGLLIDQTKGNLSATGNARSRLMLDDKITESTAHEIRYSDELRKIVYTAASKPTTAEVFLNSGLQSTLRAGSVEMTLDAKENKLQKMQAKKNVRVIEGDNRVNGAAVLDYTAAEEKYVVKGDGSTPVVLISPDGSGCRQFIGRTIEFYKGNERVIVDGGTINASTKPSTPSTTTCSPSTR
jgi:lipopolysaccharide export system protein LptA/lipopolysaccharide export system protein LptC